MAEEVMNRIIAVFNSHKNRAYDRAKEAFILMYGKTAWDNEIQTFEDQGIMTLFDIAPNEYTMFFVTLCWLFVNEQHLNVKAEP